MSQLIYLLPTCFWIWMIYECLAHDPQRNIWIWVLIFFNFPGAIVYFFVRRLPELDFPVSRRIQRRVRRDELWNAEAAAANIGNAYQWVALGDLRRDLGLINKAQDAYLQALEKEQDNLKALWGMVQLEYERENFAEAKEHLAHILKLKSDYEYGNAALLYIKVLLELEEEAAAQKLLEENIKVWNKPEAYLLLAEINLKQGETETAKQHLEKMVANIRSSPKFHYQRHRHLERKANKLLKTL
ncbi:MAG: PLDc N-terminal domain-containing protein [Cyanobacteria bacterium J06631_6]